ncbi:hypothetical protein [Butyrivibrio sp. AE2032]|uniref:hypothetical protein n=1 Tax=Butyrivibrio sp. AE2032 TaxID=1458463 RepID=UPI000551505C|nr:hypothetical protein [Butyrivibrio sp. AE2032]
MRKMSLIAAAIACAVIFVFGFSGFKSEAAMQGQSLGGWSLVDNNSPSMMKDEDSARIKTVLQDQGYNFNVLDLVATQVVSGANYMYLVYGTTADSTVPGYYFVTVYENTQGVDSIVGVSPIDVTSIQTGAPLGFGATGAWVVRGTGKAGMLPDQNAQASFDAINNGDVMYNPVALLATQVVSGTNYKALCRGNDKNLYVVTWYKNLQGNSSLTSSECVNIGAYSGL